MLNLNRSQGTPCKVAPLLMLKTRVEKPYKPKQVTGFKLKYRSLTDTIDNNHISKYLLTNNHQFLVKLQDTKKCLILPDHFVVLYQKLKNQNYIHAYTLGRKFTFHGSSFNETTRDCLLRFADFANATERQDGAHQGIRAFCSPFKQATIARLESLIA